MSTMEEDTEFRDLIIKKLENNGVLLKMKAALRAQIYNLLEKENKNDDSQTSSITNNDSSVEPYDNTTNVALSLIQDLLDCLSLDVSKSVFKAESGETAKYACQTRAELMETLQLSDGCDGSDRMDSPLNSCKVPVLVKYLTKNGVLSKSNDTFAVAASTSNSTD